MSQLGDALFSQTQQKVLGLLYAQPDRSFYTNEILRLTGMGVATIRRELDRMVAAGVLTLKRVGNQNHYQANPNCPIYAELLNITRKTLAPGVNPSAISADDKLLIGGEIEISRRALQDLARRFHINRLFLFGSAARHELGPDSDIDMLVEFESTQGPSLGCMIDIQDAFSQLFNDRKVDVATRSILNNPYRKRQIEKDLEELYAA